MKSQQTFQGIALAILFTMTPAIAQDIGSPDPEVIKGLYPGKTYSPYAMQVLAVGNRTPFKAYKGCEFSRFVIAIRGLGDVVPYR